MSLEKFGKIPTVTNERIPVTNLVKALLSIDPITFVKALHSGEQEKLDAVFQSSDSNFSVDSLQDRLVDENESFRLSVANDILEGLDQLNLSEEETSEIVPLLIETWVKGGCQGVSINSWSDKVFKIDSYKEQLARTLAAHGGLDKYTITRFSNLSPELGREIMKITIDDRIEYNGPTILEHKKRNNLQVVAQHPSVFNLTPLEVAEVAVERGEYDLVHFCLQLHTDLQPSEVVAVLKNIEETTDVSDDFRRLLREMEFESKNG